MNRDEEIVNWMKPILVEQIFPRYPEWSIFSRYFLEVEIDKIDPLPFAPGFHSNLSKEKHKLRQRFRYNMTCAMKDLEFEPWTCSSNGGSIRSWIRREALERLRASQEAGVKA
jgi:hypothetical protein